MVGEHDLSSHRLDIEWGVVENGQPRRLPDQGASIGCGDRIYIKVKNSGQEARYVHVFNVGVRGKVQLLTKKNSPSGYALNNDVPELALGERNGKLLGLPIKWPEGLPDQSLPRTDSLYVFVTEKRVSLDQLETLESFPNGGKRALKGTGLQDLLAQVQDGMHRDVDLDEPTEGFLVKQLSYELHPRKAAMADTVAFQIDQNPQRQVAAADPRAWLPGGAARGSEPIDAPTAPPPEAVAIRIGDLVVEKNRALFAADIRIDALVCTRAANQAETHSVHTLRFQGIQDGQRLPLDNARIFLGPVRDFVDICLWVSRDITRDRDLADLFAQHAASAPFKDAAGALLTTAHVAAAPWITAVGASAALARIAYDLILAATRKTIGLYRTSFLTAERFGVGRHPDRELYRAQDFSFSLMIDAVPAPATVQAAAPAPAIAAPAAPAASAP
jgi:hypothetical protein